MPELLPPALPTHLHPRTVGVLAAARAGHVVRLRALRDAGRVQQHGTGAAGGAVRGRELCGETVLPTRRRHVSPRGGDRGVGVGCVPWRFWR